MTNSRIKEALLSRCHVKFKGILYDYVSAIIYRCSDGKIEVTAELMDFNGHSITIADPKFFMEDEI